MGYRLKSRATCVGFRLTDAACAQLFAEQLATDQAAVSARKAYIYPNAAILSQNDGTLRASNIGTLAGTSNLTAAVLALGTTVDNVVGTLDTVGMPAVGDVQAGVVFGGGTGTFAAPGVSDVRSGIGYGAGGTEFVGTLVVSVSTSASGTTEVFEILDAIKAVYDGTVALSTGMTGGLHLEFPTERDEMPYALVMAPSDTVISHSTGGHYIEEMDIEFRLYGLTVQSLEVIARRWRDYWMRRTIPLARGRVIGGLVTGQGFTWDTDLVEPRWYYRIVWTVRQTQIPE